MKKHTFTVTLTFDGNIKSEKEIKEIAEKIALSLKHTADTAGIAPDESETEFTGEVKIVNSDDPDDFCIIAVSLVTPVSQQSINSLFLRFLEQHPNIFPILRHLLGL